MPLPDPKTKIPRMLDVNQYVLKHMKRKMEPLFIRTQKKVITNNAPLLSNLESIRKSEAVTNHTKAKYQILNKTKSQTINFDKQNRYQHSQDQALSKQKYDELQSRVSEFISEEKKKIEQKELNKIKVQSTNADGNPMTYHRRIISNLNAGFDYGKIRSEMEKNQRYYESQQLPQRINFQQLHDIFIGKSYETQNKQKQHRASNYLKKKEEKQISKSKKPKKRGKINTERNRKSSIFLRQIHSLQRQKPDSVDLQFREGLVEQLYTTKRIKFRNKINQIKSRNNIYDGNLYFLKE